MPGFPELLKGFREARGISQRALARASGINPAIVSRLESGDRGPSTADQVAALARALGLSPPEADSLLASAGFWPQALLALGPTDDCLLTVARVLTAAEVGDRRKDRFRRIVQLLAEQSLDDA